MSIRAYICILVLLTMLCGKTTAQDFASSQPHQSHHHRQRPAIAHKRRMSFGTRVGSYMLTAGFLIFEGDYYYAQDDALSKHQQTVASTIAVYSLAGIAVSALLSFWQPASTQPPRKV
jgi:hypothetical protein